MPWVYAARCADLVDRDVIGVNCGSERVAIYRMEAGIFATSDTCPHLGASLSEGCLVQGFIECPLHFALFDISTGESDGSVTTRGVRTYPTKVEQDTIYVDLPDPDEKAAHG